MNDQTRVKAALSMLLGSFHASQSGTAEATVGAYLTAIAGYPAEAVERAVTAFIRGEVPGQNKRFAPSAPELGSEAARMVKVMELEARPVAISWERNEPDREISEAERAEGLKQFERIKRNLARQLSDDDFEVGDPEGDRHVA